MERRRDIDIRVEDAACAGLRLDVYITERLGLFTRSQARSRIVELRVNGLPARLGRKVKNGDVISLAYTDEAVPDAKAEDIPLRVIFENDDVIVIDKPQGMVVHPGCGNRSGTLVNALLFRCRELREAWSAASAGDDLSKSVVRPGIVHRLDKDTSGVIVVAKNVRAHEFLSRQFKARTVRKRYIALVCGILPAREGRIETRIGRNPRDRKKFSVVSRGGRQALTLYRVIGVHPAGGVSGAPPAYSLVSLHPRTGRTHQLRVHMLSLRTPILGDPLYGWKDPRFPDATLMLHARALAIALPGDEASRVFTAAVPERFREILKQL